MTDYGVDISSWQGDQIDWNAVRANGITYAYIKFTDGLTYENPLDESQMRGAEATGIRTGGYHYAQPGPSPEDQADFFYRELVNATMVGPDNLAPALDMEQAGLEGSAADFVARFNARMRGHGVHLNAVYANLDWFLRYMRPEVWADGDTLIWLAQYNGEPLIVDWGHPRLAIHQHTSKGTVPGFGGVVDRNATLPGWTLNDLLIGTPEDDMPLSAADLDAVKLAVWGHRFVDSTQPAWEAAKWLTDVPVVASKVDALAGALSDDEANIIAALRQSATEKVDVRALADALVKVLPPSATPEDVDAAVRAAFARAGGA